MKKKHYMQPQCKVIEIEAADLICTSPSAQNESYEEVTTEDWYNL